MRVGIDLIEVKRFENIASNSVRMSTLFGEKEIAYFDGYKDRGVHIAGCFAAKEAVAKAFKTGFNGQITPLDIEIVHKNKVPYVNLKGGAKRFFEEQCFGGIEISISHSKTDATAICIIW
ncbi:MAG: holo-ACP synthase [Christensenellaceae bacterium]|jgi:phosphopantetheine--protein transferase-like protein|nr:holo-ACP synthase [Christensenellaceae bacterium]